MSLTEKTEFPFFDFHIFRYCQIQDFGQLGWNPVSAFQMGLGQTFNTLFIPQTNKKPSLPPYKQFTMFCFKSHDFHICSGKQVGRLFYPNMDNPNSWIIPSPLQTHLLSLIICPLSLNIGLFKRFFLVLVFWIDREVTVQSVCVLHCVWDLCVKILIAVWRTMNKCSTFGLMCRDCCFLLFLGDPWERSRLWHVTVLEKRMDAWKHAFLRPSTAGCTARKFLWGGGWK